MCCLCFFFLKQNAAYEVRISDWSSDVCSSDLSADGLAVHGFDPVAYVDDYQAVRGKAEFEASWQGARWRFSSAGNQARFLKNPAAYAPQYGGFGAYSVEIGKAYDVDPTVFDVVDGRVYLHRNARVRELWQRNPAGYIAEIGRAHV